MEDPNLQKNRKIQGSDQPARAAAVYDIACPGRDAARVSASGASLIRDRHRLERSTQVGFTRLARISSPISGKPEIGVCSAPLRAALRPGHESGRRPGRRWLWTGRSTNLRVYEMTAGAISLFRVVIYNDFCNSHVSGRRGPNLLPKMCRPICHPDVAPSVVI
jgi:hypothetical protein